MESYYSSDEEIAWGPLTLREIKSNLKRCAVRKPNRRHTALCNIQYTKMEEPLSEEVNKLNISTVSTAYYTPNESMKTNSNSDFLEKLSQVINIPCPDLSEYASASEDTGNTRSQTENTNSQITPVNIPLIFVTDTDQVDTNDTCTDFIKFAENRETHYNIENFQQTLVENTYVVSEEEDEQGTSEEHRSVSKRELYAENEFVKHEDEEIIILSDDSDDCMADSDTDDLNCSQGIVPLEGEADLHKEESIEKYVETELKYNLYENTSENNIHEQSHEEAQFHPGCDLSDEIKGEESTRYVTEDSVESVLIPNIQHKLSTIKESLITSPVIIPEIDLTQFDESIKDDSLQLNDTMEEINRMLNQGLDYSMPDDEIVNNTPAKKDLDLQQFSTPCNQMIRTNESCKEMTSHIPKRCQPTSSEKKQINKYTDTKASSKTYFKIPELPLRPKLTNPTPPKTYNLKNVVSPVALYIKNSPRIPLKQNVPLRDLSKIVTTTNPKPAYKEIFAELPEVTYKPSKKQIATTEKHIVVPGYMKKFRFVEAHIVKHEGRIIQERDRSNISKKLLLTDITNTSIDQSLLDGTGDISVLTNKQALIK